MRRSWTDACCGNSGQNCTSALDDIHATVKCPVQACCHTLCIESRAEGRSHMPRRGMSDEPFDSIHIYGRRLCSQVAILLSWLLRPQRSCYPGMPKVGQIKKLAVMSHPQLLGKAVLQRYAAYCCTRWLRRLEDGSWCNMPGMPGATRRLFCWMS